MRYCSFILLAGLLALAACAPQTTLDSAEAEHPKGSFITDLMHQKAEAARNAKVPDPEPAEETTQDAYKALIKYLTPGNRRVLANTAARAQILYDCQTLPLPEDMIASCRKEFDAAIIELANSDIVQGPHFHSTLYFKSGSAALSNKARREISKLTSRLLSISNYTVRVAGHAAASASEKRDAALSEKRVLVVRDALESQGVPAVRIRSTALGSSVPLPDIVEDNSRQDRVEIQVFPNK